MKIYHIFFILFCLFYFVASHSQTKFYPLFMQHWQNKCFHHEMVFSLLFRQYFLVLFKNHSAELWDAINLCQLREFPTNFPRITAFVSVCYFETFFVVVYAWWCEQLLIFIRAPNFADKAFPWWRSFVTESLKLLFLLILLDTVTEIWGCCFITSHDVIQK